MKQEQHSERKTRTHHVTFSDGTKLRMEVMMTKPEQGKTHIVKSEWSQRPADAISREYVEFMHAVNLTAAQDFDDGFIIHCFMLGKPEKPCEVWVYSAGGIKVELDYDESMNIGSKDLPEVGYEGMDRGGEVGG